MRGLMWYCIGFSLACGICAYGMMTPWLLPAALAAGAGVLAALFLGKLRRFYRPALAVLLGCGLGVAWFAVFYHGYIHPVTGLDGEERPLTLTVSDHSRTTDYGAVVNGVAELEGRPYQAWVYLSEQGELQPGDRITGTFQIRLTTPGGLRESSIFQGKGVFLVMNQRGSLTLSRPEEAPFWCLPSRLAGQLKSVLESLFPGELVPFTKALLLGDTWDLDYAQDTAFRISGIRHILAVSGLHISILYGLICTITLRKRFLTAALGMPGLLLFAAVAGFTPSALRACIMMWLMLLALLFDREYDPPTALAFAVLVMLVVNPMASVSAALQLSVGCVAGIILFRVPIHTWLRSRIPEQKGLRGRIWELVCGSASVSISTMVITTPLCAWYFGMVSLVGILTNLLTLWVVHLIFLGLVAACLLYPVLPALAALLAKLLCWPIGYVVATAELLSGLPFAAVYTKNYCVILWLVFVYILLAAFLLMRKKRPGLMLCCGLLGLCLALLASWTEAAAPDTRITMLDVGQGQAILLQGEGKTYLVDCGGDSDGEAADTVAETLLSQGIRRLDGIILTHYDRDHAGGLRNLLTRVDTDYLFLPDTCNEMALPQTTGKILYVWEDLKLSFGNSSITIYGPVYSGVSNENSLCVLFDTEKCDILITGDRSGFGERMLLRRTALPDVDILVAGHHGAADSTSEELLRAVRPETVLISVAENNIYSHPAPALLQRLEAFGCTVYRTDLHGTIIIRR